MASTTKSMCVVCLRCVHNSNTHVRCMLCSRRVHATCIWRPVLGTTVQLPGDYMCYHCLSDVLPFININNDDDFYTQCSIPNYSLNQKAYIDLQTLIIIFFMHSFQIY